KDELPKLREVVFAQFGKLFCCVQSPMIDFTDLAPCCCWIATADKRELAAALPANGAAVPLSWLAWRLSGPQLRAWIVPGDGSSPWRLSQAGADQALRVQRAAIANNERLVPLHERCDRIQAE